METVTTQRKEKQQKENAATTTYQAYKNFSQQLM